MRVCSARAGHPTGYPWPIETARLDNGLRVVVSEDHTAPVVCVNLWYDVGSRHEPPARPASRTSSST
ncbi:hypothetical protein GCM10020358_16740 [Amorphoplanes nipponensis]